AQALRGGQVMMARILLKRVYEKPAKTDGLRILVDRLWPRGLSKQKAKVDRWLRDIAPSAALRKWYGHDPARWLEFRRRYAKELKARPGAVTELRSLLKAHANVTLLFSSKEEKLNNAVALKAYLRK
ncbi:MAG TPA: DUF488 family protein, partial [Gammaproteobacteria bacterium]|nr:DUF488 family protein [Gammaproteobacteria bacterium]